jgi:hypothetical protein
MIMSSKMTFMVPTEIASMRQLTMKKIFLTVQTFFNRAFAHDTLLDPVVQNNHFCSAVHQPYHQQYLEFIPHQEASQLRLHHPLVVM